MKYHDRTPLVPGDATFANKSDYKHEDSIDRAIEEAWGVTIHRFGPYDAIDCYAERDGHMVGMIERKWRSHPHDRFECCWLNLRKWMALMLAHVSLDVPAIYVVGHSDGAIHWIDVTSVDARRMIMAGCRRVVKSHTDREPVIEIPVKQMRNLGVKMPAEDEPEEENVDFWPSETVAP